MLAAVSVDEEAKYRLEELQAEIQRHTGKSVTQRDLLSCIIDNAYESHEAVVDSFRDTTVPLSEEEKTAMRSG
jgi:hypothetical protein